MSNCNVTVITVCLNASKTIRATIESVLSQKGVSIEYIIIDGGSVDSTSEIINEYKHRLAYYVSEPDGGIYDAMNKGIKKATGDLVGIINADDFYVPGAIKSAFELHLSHPYAVIHGDVIVQDSTGREMCILKAPNKPSLKEQFERMTVNHPATFIPLDVYRRYGAYDVSYSLSADYELIIRLLSKGVPFVPLFRPTSNFRLGGKSGGLVTYNENFSIQLRYGRSIYSAFWWYVRALFKCMISLLIPSSAFWWVQRHKARRLLD